MAYRDFGARSSPRINKAKLIYSNWALISIRLLWRYIAVNVTRKRAHYFPREVTDESAFPLHNYHRSFFLITSLEMSSGHCNVNVFVNGAGCIQNSVSRAIFLSYSKSCQIPNFQRLDSWSAELRVWLAGGHSRLSNETLMYKMVIDPGSTVSTEPDRIMCRFQRGNGNCANVGTGG